MRGVIGPTLPPFHGKQRHIGQMVPRHERHRRSISNHSAHILDLLNYNCNRHGSNKLTIRQRTRIHRYLMSPCLTVSMHRSIMRRGNMSCAIRSFQGRFAASYTIYQKNYIDYNYVISILPSSRSIFQYVK